MCASGFYCSRLSLTFLNILYLAISFVLIGLAGYAKNAAIITSIGIIGGKIITPFFQEGRDFCTKFNQLNYFFEQ